MTIPSMPDPANPPGDSSHATPPSEVVIGSYDTARKAHEAGLAVLAAGRPYRVEAVEGRFALLVDRRHGDRLQREVEIAELRNRFWPPPSLELAARSVSKTPTAMAIALLVVAFWAQNAIPSLRELGVNDSEAVTRLGQYWRLLTAVTLHADLGHLAGNILGLSIFAYLSCRYMGNGLAWALILVAASCSNLTNALIHSESTYASLGASTAVFAALGLLSGFPLGCYLRTKEPIGSRDWLIPFFGGCVFFAWMGGGDFPTDVGGHLWSFIYGLAMAIATAGLALHSRVSERQQSLLLLAGLAMVLGSWAWALVSL